MTLIVLEYLLSHMSLGRSNALSSSRLSDRRVSLLLFGFCSTCALSSVGLRFLSARLPGMTFNIRATIWTAIEWLCSGVIIALSYRWSRRFPVSRTNWKSRLPVHAFAVAFAVVFSGVVTGILVIKLSLKTVRTFSRVAAWDLLVLPDSVTDYLIGFIVAYAHSTFIEAREREAESARLAAQLSEARLSALRMQLHPHFLFNTLNTISVLIREYDMARSARMLELLADMLRQALRLDQKHEIPLNDDLRFLEQYLEIEHVRYSDRLRVRWEIDDRTRSALVPVFLMQPLVENAIRHGIAPGAAGGTLTISAGVDDSRLTLSVRDDGVGFSNTGREGVGLANTRERLHTLYKGTASFTISSRSGKGTEALITLPLRNS